MSSAAPATPPTSPRTTILRSEIPPVKVPASAHHLDGFRAWSHSPEFPEFGRVTYLNGEVILDMSGEELETHAKIKGEIYLALGNLNRETQLGVFYPDGTQLVNAAADLSCIPDSVFVTWDSLRSGRARLVPREREPGQFIELDGTPDLVVEIVSDSSVEKDTVRLRHAYHRAGIPEYWLIDARRAAINFQI